MKGELVKARGGDGDTETGILEMQRGPRYALEGEPLVENILLIFSLPNFFHIVTPPSARSHIFLSKNEK